MNVAHIGPRFPYRGGIAHYTTLLDQALRHKGHQVLAISFKRQYPQWLFPGRSDQDPSTIPLESGKVHNWLDSLNPISWFATMRRIHQFDPDLIILPWWTTFWAPAWFVLGALARLWLRCPLLYICHNVLPHESRRWDRRVTRSVLGWGTRFIVQSQDEKKRLLELIPRARVVVVPHPIYDMFAGQRIPKDEARRLLDLPPAATVLLFFGIVREYKGLDDLLAALPMIQAQLDDVMLLVAGEFWDNRRPYLETIEKLGLGDRVRIVDTYIPNEEVALYFSAADLLVAPYRRVTGSGVVQMARGFGTPVITTHSEALGEESEGLVVPPRDIQALAAATILLGRETPIKLQRARSATWQDLVARIEESID